MPNSTLRISLVLILAWLCTAGCQHTGQSQGVAENDVRRYEAWGFTMDVPTQYEVEKKIPVDFIIYQLKDKESGNQLLFIYSGSYPSYPQKAAEDAKIRHTKVNGMKAESRTWKAPSGLFSRETLIQMYTGPRDVPMEDRTMSYLHCAYIDKSKQEAAIADGVIASIRLPKANSQ
ncbi:MAG: hypothetical protein WC655_24130 [Candidatus Hydrogenedentales bacterium]|jgi:hypothetical protein